MVSYRSRPLYPRGKSRPGLLKTRLGGPQSWSGRFGGEGNPLNLARHQTLDAALVNLMLQSRKMKVPHLCSSRHVVVLDAKCTSLAVVERHHDVTSNHIGATLLPTETECHVLVFSHSCCQLYQHQVALQLPLNLQASIQQLPTIAGPLVLWIRRCTACLQNKNPAYSAKAIMRLNN